MKNLYIILNHGIGNIGGGQLYVSSKKRYMEEIGWSVQVYYFLDGDILIPNLQEYKNNIIPELTIYPMYYSKCRVKKILSLLSSEVNPNDNVIIESNSISLSLWGELLAKKLKAKHIIYNLNENIHISSRLLNFFQFKLIRNELAGITKSSIPDFFKGFIDDISGEDTCLSAHYDTHNIADIPYDIPTELCKKEIINVCICGRLVKPFVKKAIEQFAIYTSQHKNLNFNLVIIGGDDSNTNFQERFKELFRDSYNVNCIITGFMYPIPTRLLKSIHYGISSSGFVTVLSRCGVKTLSIDCNDLLPIGIRGITTSNNLHRDKEIEIAYDYSYWFDKMFVTKEFDYRQIELPPIVTDNYKKLSSHMDFIYKSSSFSEYNIEFGRVSFIKKIIVVLFGYKSYIFLHRLLKKTHETI